MKVFSGRSGEQRVMGGEIKEPCIWNPEKCNFLNLWTIRSVNHSQKQDGLIANTCNRNEHSKNLFLESSRRGLGKWLRGQGADTPA